MAVLRERVHEAGDEWRLGTDNRQLHLLARDRRGDPVDVLRGDVEQPRVLRDTGVARRAEQLRALRRARERADDRVLTPTRADHQDLHARITGRR